MTVEVMAIEASKEVELSDGNFRALATAKLLPNKKPHEKAFSIWHRG